MASHSSDEEENYWPGYVDALTTMTMVLTFIMMVLGVVVFTLGQNVSKTVVLAIAAATSIDTSSMDLRNAAKLQDAVVAALNARRTEEGAAVSAPQAQTAAAAPAGAATTDLTVAALSDRIDGQIVENARRDDALPRTLSGAQTAVGESLRILYTNAGVRMGEAETGAIQGYLAMHPRAEYAIQSDVVQTLAVNSGGATEGRRRAYYRAMLVREQMIKSGVRAESIALQIRDAAPGVEVDTVTVTARKRVQP